MNRREFVKQAVTTTVLFGVASLGLAELLVMAKARTAAQAPIVLQAPPTTSVTVPPTTDPGNQSGTSGGTTGGASGGTSGGSSGETAGGTPGGSGGGSGTSGGQGSAQQPPSGYIYLAAVSAVTGSSAYFGHPSGGPCILVDYNGTWRAFSAICTHAGCTCNFTGSSLYCPCHGASFSATNGGVNSGPTNTPLGRIRNPDSEWELLRVFREDQLTVSGATSSLHIQFK